MGKIINFNKRPIHKNLESKHKKIFNKKWLIAIITSITTFCTVTGITVSSLLEKDWQAIAEEYNNDGLELYNLGKYEEAIDFMTRLLLWKEKGLEI